MSTRDLAAGDPPVLEAASPDRYLGADPVVETGHPAVAALGADLRARHRADAAFARAAFEWVRDTIAHSFDARDPRVTLTASQVLAAGAGLCYAKSHLLTAVLRSQGVPAGLCYQRLGDPDDGYVVHGLVAVWLDGAWHRQDPRGNKPGIDARFSLGTERIAFRADPRRGERDYPRIRVHPAAEVVEALQGATNVLTCVLPSGLA